MSIRTWLYATLTDPNDALGRSLIADRVFPKKSMKSAVEEHPYIVYKLGNKTDEGLAEESSAHRQYIQIWVHDYSDTDVADYNQIDSVLSWLKGLLDNAGSPADHVLMVQYLETSQDLNDETLSTVFKYMRFVAILGE